MADSFETKFVHDFKPDSNAVVELKNGKFVDVEKGCFFDPGVSLLIKEGKIASMPGLEDETTEMRPDCTIDLQGKTVMPGLFNSHCHVQMMLPTLLMGLKDIKLAKKYKQDQLEKNMNECLAHGITNIRDAYTDDLQVSRSFKDRIHKRDIFGPRIQQSVVVVQPNGYMSQKTGLSMRMIRTAARIPIKDFADRDSGILVFPKDADEKVVRDAVDRAIDERGAEAIKITEQRTNMNTFEADLDIMTIEQFSALTDQARERGLQSTMHQVSVESFRRGIEGHISSFAHMARDEELTAEDIKAFVENGCIVEPTLSVGYDMSWKVTGDEWENHPNLDQLSQYRDKIYGFADLAEAYYIPELRESVRGAYDKFVSNKFKLLGLKDLTKMVKNYACVATCGAENFRKLYQAGARMALANDGGVPPCTPAMMDLELALFDLYLNNDPDEKRFTGADALKIATINSACSMGMEEAFGSIKTGKTADLAVVDGDPFEDFQVVGKRVAALFMDGRLVINSCGLEV